jgi:Raf kinase inhibitor-like YbhB/YbcL family protein
LLIIEKLKERSTINPLIGVHIMKAPFNYNTYEALPEAAEFELLSSDIVEGGTMPAPQLSKAFGVEGGEDCSPALNWRGFPADTKSFVVSCYDPDAPTVSGFWHWIMYDIPASVSSLPTGAGSQDGKLMPAGAKMLKNDAGFAGFCGAAPPPSHGNHRYIFCVSAMPVENLPIDEAVSPAVCHFNMFGIGVLARGFLTAHYGR